MPDSRGLGLGSRSLREKNRVAKGLALLDGHTLEFLSNETEFGLGKNCLSWCVDLCVANRLLKLYPASPI